MLPPLSREEALLGVREFDPSELLEKYLPRFPRAFEVMRICGVHPTTRTTVTNPYTGEQLDEDFTNIGYHMLTVARCAEVIAEKLLLAGKIGHLGCEHAIEHALTHDALKIFELCRFRAYHARKIDSGLFLQHDDAAAILAVLPMPKDLRDYILQTGEETGGVHVGAMLEPTPSGIQMKAGNLIAKIVRIADSITYSMPPRDAQLPRSYFLTPWKRLVAAESVKRYPLCLQHGFGLTHDNRIILLEDIEFLPPNCQALGHMLYLETLLGNWICGELMNLLNPHYNGKKPEQDFMDVVNGAVFGHT